MLNKSIVLTLLASCITLVLHAAAETKPAASKKPVPKPAPKPAPTETGAPAESKPTPPPAPKPTPIPTLPPVPLPEDPHVSVDVTFTGTYRTLFGNEERKMSLRAEMTQVVVKRTPETTTTFRDTFAYVQAPEEKGWGLFYPANDRFSVNVTLTDDRNRLGAALVRAERNGEAAEVIGRIKADGQGRLIKGALPIDPSAPTYTITIFSQESGQLARVDAAVPRSLRLEFLDVRYGFRPRRPLPDPECPMCAGKDVPKAEQGDPKSLEGRTLLPAPTRVEACIAKAYENVTEQRVNLQPPLALQTVANLRDSIGAWRERMEEKLWGEYNAEITQSYLFRYDWLTRTTQDKIAALNPLSAPPTSQGCGHWDVELTGEVVTIVAVPLERVRALPDWDAQLRRVIQQSTAQQPLASASLAVLLNERLSKAAPSAARQLQSGDVLAVGDVWLLHARLLKAEVQSKPLSRLVPAPPREDK